MKNSLIIKSLEQLGHRINNTVPSLFSFDLDNHPFRSLAGVSVQSVRVSIPDLNLSQVGPVLFTHRGISGPAVIKLSAWAAQALHLKNYKFNIEINWLENHDYERVEEKSRSSGEAWQNHLYSLVLFENCQGVFGESF